MGGRVGLGGTRGRADFGGDRLSIGRVRVVARSLARPGVDVYDDRGHPLCVVAPAPPGEQVKLAAKDGQRGGGGLRGGGVCRDGASGVGRPEPGLVDVVGRPPTFSGRTPPPSRRPKRSTARCGHRTRRRCMPYASGSASASRLASFSQPPQTTDPTGTSSQDAAVSQAVTTSAGNQLSPTAMAQVVNTVPNVLQTLAGESGGASSSDILNVAASGTYVASGVLFILGPLFTGPVNAALPPTILGAAAPALGAPGRRGRADGRRHAHRVGRGQSRVLAGQGRAGSVGGLSVPQTWGAAVPEAPRAATAIPAPALVGFPEAEVDPLGPGLGGVLPGSLMAAAAGGGGAAGGGFAATRGAGACAAQRRSCPARRTRTNRRRAPGPIPPPTRRGTADGSRSKRRRAGR